MGKERTPEEIAARKEKKERGKVDRQVSAEAREEAARAAAASAKKKKRKAAASAKKAPKKVVSKKEAATALRAVRGRGPDDWPHDLVSIFTRLDPDKGVFDAELKAAWGAMPTDEKNKLVDDDVARRRRSQASKVFPFTPNADDHCETSPRAYEHIAPVLQFVAQRLGKSPSELRIYDPYYCAGSVKRHLAACGFPAVHNECEDFYARLSAGDIPDHDVVVSNPPYSEDAEGGINHIERLVQFCTKNGKPFLLNMPEYVHDAAYYKRHFSKHGPSPLLLCPRRRCHFWTPLGLREVANKKGHKNSQLGQRSSPFVSLWYVSLEPAASHKRLLRRVAEQHVDGVELAEGLADAEGLRSADAEKQTAEGETAPADAVALGGVPDNCVLCRESSGLPAGRMAFNGEFQERQAPKGNAPEDENAGQKLEGTAKQRRAAKRHALAVAWAEANGAPAPPSPPVDGGDGARKRGAPSDGDGGGREGEGPADGSAAAGRRVKRKQAAAAA